MNNVEDGLEERTTKEMDPPSNWIEKANIEIKNLNIRYREKLPLVLKNLNLRIEDKEKIGIVGRTGSGKSSLFLALTRMIEMD